MSALTEQLASLMAKGEEISARWKLAFDAYQAAEQQYHWAAARADTQGEDYVPAWARRDGRLAQWDAALETMDAIQEEQRANSRAVRDLLIG